MLHWVINPLLVFNELVLGQRIPKLTLVEQTTDAPLVERTVIPCPHCQSHHNARTWSPLNNTAYKNYFGLYCPTCGGIIPCLQNLTSRLLIILTFPFWVWFKDWWKAKWLEEQPARFQNLDLTTVPDVSKSINWVESGLRWGGLMFVFMTFLVPLFSGTEITLIDIAVGLVVWTLGGLGFGYTFKKLIVGLDKKYINKKGSASA